MRLSIESTDKLEVENNELTEIEEEEIGEEVNQNSVKSTARDE